MKSYKHKIDPSKKLDKAPKYKILSHRLASYLYRLLFAILCSTTLIWVLSKVGGIPGMMKNVNLLDYAQLTLVFMFLMEAQILTDKGLEKCLPFPYKIRWRMFVQTLCGIAYMFIAYKFMMRNTYTTVTIPKHIVVIGLAFTIIIIGHLTSMLLTFRWTENWISVQNEMQKLKQEKLKSDYNALQDQLNPHFLFNNLSVLKSLITYDKEGALKFTDNFTDVYRYVLENGNSTTIELSQELKFMDSIISMHKERIGEAFQTTLQINKDYLTRHIAPLSLQLLLENALKHNIASKQMPLHVSITTQENAIVVRNNIQLKSSSYSTHTGLNNLIKRYALIAPNREVKIDQNNEYFEVSIPL